VRDASYRVDDVDPLGPCGERVADGIVHAVDEHGHGQPEPLDARTCGGEAILDRDVIRDEYVLVDVRLHLPPVRRVCLGDVDEHERRSIAVAAIQALEVARPTTKRRSGEAAEDEDERAAFDQRPERNGPRVVEREEVELGQGISDPQAVGAA
jgi:hypothetical protein